MMHIIPFSLEDKLIERGGKLTKADTTKKHIVTTGRLLTGENQGFALRAADAVVDLLKTYFQGSLHRSTTFSDEVGAMLYWAKIRLRTLAWVVLFLSASLSIAQDAGSQKLSLAEALALASKQNVDLMIARLRVLESNQATHIARAALLPQVNLSYLDLVTRFDRQSISGGDQLVALGPYQVVQGGPAFSQVLFDLGAVRHLEAARQAETTTQSNELTVEQTIDRSVITQYLTIARADAELNRADARLAIAQRLETEAEHLQTSGVGTSIDTLRARYELETERQSVIVAEAALRIAKQQLIELLLLPPDEKIEIVPLTNVVSADSVNIDMGAALRDRPEEAAAKSEVQHADLQRKAAEAQRLPVLQFTGFWQQQGRTFGGMIPAYTYQGTATLPIFTSGRIRAEIRSASIEKQRALETQHGIEAAISYQVAAAQIHQEASKNALAVAKQAVALAHQELVQAEHRFGVGVANNIELVTAQQSLATADANEIASDYLYQQAIVDLYRALGRIADIGAQP
ncbi:MAG: TolC family protein [Acidobacteriaceae bacterium]